MTTRYVPINEGEIRELLETQMGFKEQITAADELVFQRQVITTGGDVFPYMIQVWTSVDSRSGCSRPSGEDAIRVVVLDMVTHRPVKKSGPSIHRTKNALRNLRKRCRSEFRDIINAPKCQCCGAVMFPRENRKTGHRFLSCSRFAPGKPYHCTGTRHIST